MLNLRSSPSVLKIQYTDKYMFLAYFNSTYGGKEGHLAQCSVHTMEKEVRHRRQGQLLAPAIKTS